MPFRMEGVRIVMTPRPDDAELAAQALLETLCEKLGRSRRGKQADPGQGTPEYYRLLSRRIQDGRAAESRAALRIVAYTEQELQSGGTPPSELEAGLYRHFDAVEREGGDLLRRWQHCLAECIVRQMPEESGETTE